jgi:hypothetical protein
MIKGINYLHGSNKESNTYGKFIIIIKFIK